MSRMALEAAKFFLTHLDPVVLGGTVETSSLVDEKLFTSSDIQYFGAFAAVMGPCAVHTRWVTSGHHRLIAPSCTPVVPFRAPVLTFMTRDVFGFTNLMIVPLQLVVGPRCYLLLSPSFSRFRKINPR